jgi:hypothetical protein
MDKDEKLIEDVKALLTAAGFEKLTTTTSPQGIVLSGDRGSGGAVFFVTPQKQTKDATGAPNPEVGKIDVSVSPAVADLGKLLVADPAAAAKLLGVPPETVQAALRLQPQ